MRIGIDIKAFKNGQTGISRYLKSILDALQEIENDNEYILFECKETGYRIKNPRWKKVLIKSRLPGILWQQIRLPGHLNKLRVDVLWAPEQTCPYLLRKKIKVITTVLDFTIKRFPKTCKSTNVWIYRIFFPLALKRSRYLVPISDYVKRELLEYFPAVNKCDVRTVNCGAPGWKLPENYSHTNRKNNLFFAGNLEPRKNLLRLIAALEVLQKKGCDIPLTLAGTMGWKNSDLLNEISNGPVSKNISMLGYLPEEELKEQFLTCKAVIFPSVYEGFGLPVLEALEMDSLVLTSKGTVMEEIAGKAALYFDPCDIQDMAKTIESVYSPKFNRETCLQYRDEVINKYQWKESAFRLQQLFKA